MLDEHRRWRAVPGTGHRAEKRSAAFREAATRKCAPMGVEPSLRKGKPARASQRPTFIRFLSTPMFLPSNARRSLTAIFCCSLLAATGFPLPGPVSTAQADEGMWLFTSPPAARLKEKYKFEPTPAWLEHLQKSSVRFNSGGSGSFVSADGLVITNHHVGADSLQKLSDEQHNYLRDGFYAKTRADEKKCLDLELNVLMSVEDVTARVSAAVPADLDPEKAVTARRAVLADIEKESKEKTGLRSDVVTLYQGGAYHLYRFKRYDDVRLVFAPEQGIAFFGGDPDNFEYPRFNLDICIFRAYENGQPARPGQFLKWSANGPAAGSLAFVSGHPGSTSRQLTLAELADQRDRALPRLLARLYRREVLLSSFSERSMENARRARDELFGIQNAPEILRRPARRAA